MPSITIKKANGTVDTIIPSNKVLGMRGGGSMVLSTDGFLVAAEVEVDHDRAVHYYSRNVDAIISHTNSAMGFTFEDGGEDGYYISKINGVPPMSSTYVPSTGPSRALNDFYIVGDSTVRISEVTTDQYQGLQLLDIGRPDLDCADYIQLYTYVSLIRSALDGIKDQIIGEPERRIDSRVLASVYGVHRQYQALQHLWNFLVQNLGLVVNVSYQESGSSRSDIYIQVRISNNTSEKHVVSPVRISMAKVSTSYSSVYIRADKIVKISRSTSGPKIEVAVAPTNERELNNPGGHTWNLSFSALKTGQPIELDRGESMSVSIQIAVYTKKSLYQGTVPLPGTLYFTTSTKLLNSVTKELEDVARTTLVHVNTSTLAREIETGEG